MAADLDALLACAVEAVDGTTRAGQVEMARAVRDAVEAGIEATSAGDRHDAYRLGWTTRTGRVAVRTTRAATLPRERSHPER